MRWLFFSMKQCMNSVDPAPNSQHPALTKGHYPFLCVRNINRLRLVIQQTFIPLLLLYLVFSINLCASLQKKSNAPSYQNRCVLRLILYHICVNLPVMIFSYPAFKFMGLRSSLPLPHWYSYSLSFTLLATKAPSIPLFFHYYCSSHLGV